MRSVRLISLSPVMGVYLFARGYRRKDKKIISRKDKERIRILGEFWSPPVTRKNKDFLLEYTASHPVTRLFIS